MATGKPLSPCYLIPDNPIKTIGDGDTDSFQFQPFVQTFVSLAMNKHNGTPFTVVIDGLWGSGKTTLMKMTEARLDEEKRDFAKLDDEKKAEFKKTHRPCKTFWFNAWKYSNDDHLLTALLLVMFKGMEDDTGFWDAVKTKIDGKSFFSGLVNQYWGKLTGGDATEYMNELRLAKNSAFLDEFTNLMRRLISNYCSGEEKEDEGGAFVIFIDDLDRCPPDRVLQVLEAVKLFLDIPGCIFFIGMEVEQVKQAIQTQYQKRQEREDFDSARYLEKIIQIHVKIPPVAETNMENYLEQLYEDYKSKEGFEEKFPDDVKKIFLAAGCKTQRSLKRAINDYLFLEALCVNMPDLEFEK